MKIMKQLFNQLHVDVYCYLCNIKYYNIMTKNCFPQIYAKRVSLENFRIAVKQDSLLLTKDFCNVYFKNIV